MIVCSFIQQNSTIIFRPVQKISQSIFENIILKFNTTTKNDEGVIHADFLNIHYSRMLPYTCAIITRRSDKDYTSYNSLIKTILTTIQKYNDIEDIIGAFDDLLNEFTYFKLDATQTLVIREMDSYEEKVRNLEMKTVEEESVKMMKEISAKVKSMGMSNKVVIDNKDATSNNLVANRDIDTKSVVGNNYSALTNHPTTNNFEKLKDKIRNMHKPAITKQIHLMITERKKLTVDKEGKIRDSGVSGDLSLLIRDKEFCDVTVHIKNCPSGLKYSPNLEKDAAKKKILKARKSFPAKKSVTLVKWNTITKEGDSEVDSNSSNDFSFSLWQTRNNGCENVVMDYEKNGNIEEILFYFNTNGFEFSSNLANNEGNSNVVWKNKEDADNIEFNTRGSIFPIKVYFCGRKNSVDKKNKIEVEKILLNGEDVSSNSEVVYFYEAEDVTIID